MKAIKIEHHLVGPGHPPFIVAEVSANHGGSLERALELVDAAKAAGAHALKLQTYTPDTMTLDLRTEEFIIREEALWKGRALYDLYAEAYTPWEWHEVIFDHCRRQGLVAFSTPFDPSAVDFLESLNVPCYKIASLELGDHPLIRKVVATGKPLILSTGAATLGEIAEAVSVARDAGCRELILLKCTATYPASPLESHLATIPHLSQCFDLPVGLSDHTLGIGAALASVAMGSCLIEKHFTLLREESKIDGAFSLEPAELKQLVQESHAAWQAIGNVSYEVTAGEQAARRWRRSLYFVKDLAAGELITEEGMRAIRPGGGLPPKYYETLIGRRLVRPVKRGDPVSWDAVCAHED